MVSTHDPGMRGTRAPRLVFTFLLSVTFLLLRLAVLECSEDMAETVPRYKSIDDPSLF